jgi:hypothetical protein
MNARSIDHASAATSSRKRLSALGIAAAALIAGIAVAGVPAAAKVTQHHAAAFPATRVGTLASQDGSCDVGDVCLYYYTRALGHGSFYDTSHNDPDLRNNHFISAGSGHGQRVASNAEAVWNRDARTAVRLCTGLSSTGSCLSVSPNTVINLPAAYADKVQSITWADSTN